MKAFMSGAAMSFGVVATAVLFASTAFAHGAPYTITAGTAAPGTVVAATGTATGTVTFRDQVTAQSFICAVSVLKGSTTTGMRGNPIASVHGATAVFGNAGGTACSSFGGLRFAITGYGTWNLVASDSTNGVTKGTLTNIRAHVQATNGINCAFDLGLNSSTTGFSSSGTSTVTPGTQGGTYTNSTNNIATDPAKSALAMWNVNPAATNHNCISNAVFKQGDAVSFNGTYNLRADTSAYNPIAVT